MPALIQSYDVLLDFTNDTHQYTTLQLLRDYNNRNAATAVLIAPGETITLVLSAGSVYKYVLKLNSKVASVTARTWQDMVANISQLFVPSSGVSPTGLSRPNGGGITVDRVFRDMRLCLWDWDDQ